MWTIRPCGIHDAQALALIGQATFLESYAELLEGSNILAHCRAKHSESFYTKWLGSPTASTWLAEVTTSHSPIGYCLLDESSLPIADPQPTDIELHRIYVLHRYHGIGLGTALMDQAVAVARQRGKRRILLGVYERNAPALAFYARHGFQQVSERQFTVGAVVCRDAVLGRVL